MGALTIVSAVLASLVAGYLFFALLYPEKLQ